MPAQRTTEEARDLFLAWMDDVLYDTYAFKIVTRESCLYLQASFRAECAVGGGTELQHTRQWLLHPDMTRSEVVSTAMKLVLTSVEHEARENFKYRGKAIFGPHYNVDVLHEVCTSENTEHRPVAVKPA